MEHAQVPRYVMIDFDVLFVLFVLDLVLSPLCVEPRVLLGGRSSALSFVNGHGAVFPFALGLGVVLLALLRTSLALALVLMLLTLMPLARALEVVLTALLRTACALSVVLMFLTLMPLHLRTMW